MRSINILDWVKASISYFRNSVDRIIRNWTHRYTWRAILLIGFIHGMIYVFLIPPWWHHEEAPHFEYAWLAAHSSHWPQSGEFDNDLRRQIGESMLDTGFENLVNLKPENLQDDKIWIGRPQLEDPPVYPWLVSWPLRLLTNTSVLFQMYIVRIISLGLFLLSIWLSYQLMREIVSEKNPLLWVVPVFLATLPGYVDGMVGVHNDVAGAVAASLFLWLSIRWIKRGFSLIVVLGWAVSILLCFYASTPAKTLVIVAPLVPLIYLLSRRATLVFGILIGVGLIIFSILALDFHNAEAWFYTPSQSSPNRIINAQAPDGRYVFSITQKGNKTFSLGQYFPVEMIKPLRNKEVTIGAWIWADKVVKIDAPRMVFRTSAKLQRSPRKVIRVNKKPTFYTITFTVPFDASQSWLLLLPKKPQENAQIYYDGFIFVEGNFATKIPPDMETGGISGEWNGGAITNLMRNASAEKAGLSFKPVVDVFFSKIPYVKIRPSLILSTLLDYKSFGWYYTLVGSQLNQGFWGRAAAAQVPLMGSSTYAALRLLIILSVVGLIGYLVRFRSLWQRNDLLLLGIVLLAAWIPTILRGSSTMFGTRVTMPYTRYAFPAIFPTALVFTAGFLQILQWIRSRFKLSVNFPAIALLAFMFALDIFAIVSFGGYFYPWFFDAGNLLLLGLLAGFSYIAFAKAAKIPRNRE